MYHLVMKTGEVIIGMLLIYVAGTFAQNDQCGHVVPVLQDNDQWSCNDSSINNCNFVRFTGVNRTCAQCCMGNFYDDGQCIPCGTCDVEFPIKMAECKLDGNDKVCRTYLPPVYPSNCTVPSPPAPPSPPAKKLSIGVIVGIVIVVLLVLVLIAAVLKRMCWMNNQSALPGNRIENPHNHNNGYHNPNDRPRHPEAEDTNGMTDIIGTAYEDEQHNIEPNAPGYSG